MKRIFTTVIVVCMMLIASIAWSDIIHVPGDYPTIQAGINAAVSGKDTVLVADGTYNENIDFNGKAIVVMSESGPTETTIHGTGNVVIGATGSTIQGFTITGGGYGIYAYLATMTIRDNIITGNGSGIGTSNYREPLIEKNLIYNNSSNGIHASFYSEPTIINNTIASNGGHGISSWTGAGLVVNNIIVFNGSNGIYCSTLVSSPEISYNNVYGNQRGDYSGCEPGEGDISGDPLFVDPENGDYHLQPSSPSIDAGNPVAFFNDTDGSRNDMGYSGGGSGLITNFSDSYNFCTAVPPSTTVFTIRNIRLTDFSAMVTLSDPTNFSLDVVNPFIVPSLSTRSILVTFNPLSLGQFTAQVVFNSDDFFGTSQAIVTLQGEYRSAMVIHVPGDYPNIQTAIDVACDGDIILVADGTYTGDKNRNLDFGGKAITVTSENGPEYCIIDCESAGRGFIFYSSETEASVVNGFTIRNGYTGNHGGGIVCFFSSSPTITNCIISGNTATGGSSGGGISCWDSSPTITNCTISGNTATLGGGIVCFFSSFPTITNCILWNDSPDEIYGGNPVVTYSDVQGGWLGEGNIDADPLFVDPENRDYHLQAGSPCIDAGDPNSPKDPDGTRADMGAFYFDQSAPRPGDVSGNGTVSAHDAAMVLQYVVGLITLTDTQKGAADVSKNGTVSAYDAALILQYVVGLIPSFPAESEADAPILNITPESKLLAKAIKELEGIHLDDEQKRVVEQLKRLLSNQQPIPVYTALHQNYPNPFNPETWLPYQLATDSPVMISIYNAKGQVVRTITLGNKPAGVYMTKDRAAYWNGRDRLGQKVSSGVYYYTLQARKFIATRKMVIMK
ncbi:MAG: right-handed parallel beta-helix repeat-containing protein [Candidatus Poribacteria bacterium]